MGKRRGLEMQEEEAGVRSVRRTWDEINAYQRVAPTEFSLIFSIFKESSVTMGATIPSLLLYPPSILPSTKNINASWLALPQVSWTHAILHPRLGG